MEIIKVINNNTICAIDKNNRESIVMGKGIGFNKKVGDKILKSKIEKIFRMESQSSINKLKELIENLPEEHVKVSAEIISYAKRKLGKRLNQNVYITLTDHVNFAIERYKNDMKFKNPLYWEIKQFYKSEYMIGEYALNLIKERLGVELIEDEAASIALHIVNAQYNTDIKDAMKITTLTGEILNTITEFLGEKLDEESLHYSRLITHLKFLSQRVFMNELLQNTDEVLIGAIVNAYPKEYECALTIKQHIEQKYKQKISSEELAYLTVHIRRVSTVNN